MTPQEKVVEKAKSFVGYLEKKTNDVKYLYDFKANAGTNNYTQFSYDLAKVPWFNGTKYGVSWCSVFYSAINYYCFGDVARKMLYQPSAASNCAAGCKYAAQYYKNNKAFYSTPEVGDQIFFGTSSEWSHTGIVIEVTNDSVITVEGNTNDSGSNNGNGVYKKKYSKNYKRILGYGRPNWSLVKEEVTPAQPSKSTSDAGQKEEEEEMTQEQFNKFMDEYLKERNARNVSNWAKETWTDAKSDGLTDGTSPQGFATREQVVALIERAKNK